MHTDSLAEVLQWLLHASSKGEINTEPISSFGMDGSSIAFQVPDPNSSANSDPNHLLSHLLASFGPLLAYSMKTHASLNGITINGITINSTEQLLTGYQTDGDQT